MRDEGFERVNRLGGEALRRLEKEAPQPIAVLPARDIGLGIESTVDGVHPNDIGMMEYARAYEKAIRNIFESQTGK